MSLGLRNTHDNLNHAIQYARSLNEGAELTADYNIEYIRGQAELIRDLYGLWDALERDEVMDLIAPGAGAAYREYQAKQVTEYEGRHRK